MRFVVISENTNNDETYVDYAKAASREKALAQVSDLRGDGTDGHLAVTKTSVFTSEELRGLADSLDNMSEDDLLHWFDDLKEELGR